MNFPKISIVTPSFNQAQFLEETIQSVLNQNYPNLEYIIIDGGSSDGSVEIIKKYEKYLHFWISEKDEGHGHALNKGFSHTSGEIMAWINSDDKYTPWSFKTVAEIFTLFPYVNWIVGFNSWWNATGAMISVARIPKNIYDFLLGNYCWIQQESTFWRRSLWEQSGGYINQNYRYMVDGELWTRFFLYTDLYSVDCILSGYRYHQTNRATMMYQSCLQEMDQAIKIMRQKCSKKVLQNSTKLNIIRKIKKCIPLSQYVPLSKYRHNIFFPSALRASCYKNIYYEHEKSVWLERTLPYSL